MIVRQATETDIPLLTVLFDEYRQFYGSSSNLEQTQQFLYKRFKNKQSVIFISLKDDVIVGFIVLYLGFSTAECAEYYILDDTYVTPSYRRQGAAHQLIDTAILYARQQKALRISLQTSGDNIAAKILYEKLGFVLDEEFDTYHCFL
ncbi:GNAT family N-acetyltransferase [Acinetobacter populi]|jgi:ribosomal protein S18 acetylase RimI-like enzyme|uniref:GNAT family N-acetyltransferase n=1 Tax=Acinetobacter populi TaxID=1582270 RepID=A0A1Z9YYV1_9GAMM|nr:GNAT family N-acetyltransferase [Acinetobacter populi]MCH4247466.1 GNAT family N-acetyltransferase [Acinetobacter populi]OUY07404.1 GNAT family N-acetyltransferase [Acinetobacter populi]